MRYDFRSSGHCVARGKAEQIEVSLRSVSSGRFPCAHDGAIGLGSFLTFPIRSLHLEVPIRPYPPPKMHSSLYCSQHAGRMARNLPEAHRRTVAATLREGERRTRWEGVRADTNGWNRDSNWTTSPFASTKPTKIDLPRLELPPLAGTLSCLDYPGHELT